MSATFLWQPAPWLAQRIRAKLIVVFLRFSPQSQRNCMRYRPVIDGQKS